MKLVLVVKVYWLFMVYCIVYVMLFRFINEIFNFCIDNVIGKPVINKCLFYIFNFIKEDSSLALEISVFIMIVLL